VTPSSITADLVVDSGCLLGEGPTWDADRERLLWLDIDGRILHQLDSSGVHTTVALDRRITVVVPAADGCGLIAAVDSAVVHLDEEGRIGRVVATLPRDGDGETNDGRCDPVGRLWVGTTDRSGSRRAGLFCVDSSGSSTKVRGDVGLSNGLDWSPDGSVCHYVDSFAHCVQNLYLGADGLPVRSETLVEIEATPDGLTVDADRGIWVALWDGGAVHRYTPDGRLDRVVAVPSGFVTSCAFGGTDHSTLYITTARVGLSDADLQRQPRAGGLFAADVGVRGCGYTAFGPTARRR
jgi:sugar lactone lactonase YvrE